MVGGILMLLRSSNSMPTSTFKSGASSVQKFLYHGVYINLRVRQDKE